MSANSPSHIPVGLPLVLVCWSAAAVALWPFAAVPFIDDWVYAWSVENLLSGHGLEVLVPAAEEHDWLNAAIYEELVHGHVLDRTRRRVVELIHGLWDAGAEGVLLGCTELELLIHQADVDLPVFPCTTLHVEAALDRALSAPLG